MGFTGRGQFRLVDAIVCGAVLVGLLLLIPPALAWMRERARCGQCQENLRRIGMGLEAHHLAYGQYPAAAIQPNNAAAWVLKKTGESMVASHANWAILLLPYMDEEQLATDFHRQKPISDSSNAKVRTAELPWMTCSADAYHRPDNPYRCVLNTDEEILYARGNYGINAGCGFVYMPEPGGPNKPVVDGLQSLAEGSRTIQWGNGIAGINKSFSKKDMVNGLATTVAIDELPRDSLQ